MMRWIGALALVAAVTGALAVGTASAQETGRVRVIHASPDAPAVDVLVDGTAAFKALAFGKATDYAELTPGTYKVQVVPAGASEPVVIEVDLTVEAGKDATVLAVGRLADIRALPLADNLGAPAAGKAHVRFVHASPDAPAVDVAVKGGPALFRNVAFGGASAYLPVDGGTVDLEVRPTGTETVALAVPGVTLVPGSIYTVVADGLLEGTPALRANLLVDAVHEQAAVSAQQASEMPAQLPKTGATDSLPLALVGLAAVAVFSGLAMRRAAVRVRAR